MTAKSPFVSITTPLLNSIPVASPIPDPPVGAQPPARLMPPTIGSANALPAINNDPTKAITKLFFNVLFILSSSFFRLLFLERLRGDVIRSVPPFFCFVVTDHHFEK